MSPNWCHDELDITGPKDQIALFKEIMSEYNKYTPLEDDQHTLHFAISAFYPQPFNIGENWYEWRCTNWGCKWDVSDSNLIDEGGAYLKYDFDTPWGPPLAAIAMISTQFSKLLFTVRYTEPGMNFGGTFVVQDGHVSLNEEHTLAIEEREGV